MIYSCTHMATVDVKGFTFTTIKKHQKIGYCKSTDGIERKIYTVSK